MVEDGRGRGVVRDLAEQQRLERAVTASEARFEGLAAAAPTALVGIANDGRLTFASAAACDLLGYDQDELPNLTVRELMTRASWERVTALLAPAAWGKAGPTREPAEWVRGDGSLVELEATIGPHAIDGDFTGVLIELADTSQLRLAEERIRDLTELDQLTRIPNREHFARAATEQVGQAAESETGLALLVIGLDRFRAINNGLGHETGDALLVQLAGRLRAELPRDVLLARFAGDEFVALVPHTGAPGDAAVIAEAVARSLQRPSVIDAHEFVVGASIGIAMFPEDGGSYDELLKHADAAMYRAKAGGGGAFRFANPASDGRLRGDVVLERDLRRATQLGEFVLFYQPQIDPSSGKIRQLEALLRWEHPTRGLIPPSGFIGSLEDTGLIVEVGAWVIREACAQLRRWHDEGLGPIAVAVNLSARQLSHDGLVAEVEDALRQTGLDPSLLELEITESVAAENPDAAIRVMDALQQLGVSTALDDFGTGHSSLSRLRQFPLHTLKIDRSFVHGVARDPDDHAIVGGIVALGQALGLRIVAEGVERDDQYRVLADLGCDLVQGFLFGRPLPQEAVRLMLAGPAMAVVRAA